MGNLTFAKIFGYVAAFTAASFALSYGFATVAGDKPYPEATLEKLEKQMNGMQKEVNLTKEWNASEIQEIEVVSDSINIKLEDSQDDLVHAHTTGFVGPEFHIEYVQEKGKLNVRVKRGTGSFRWTFGGGQAGLTTNETYLSLSLPKNFTVPIHIQTGSGDISAKNAKLSDVEVDTGSGDVEWKVLSSDRLKIKTGSGDLSLSGEVLSLTTQTASGDVSMHEVKGNNLEVSTASGDVLVKLKGDAQHWSAHATTRSGDIHSNLPDATGVGTKSFAAGKGKDQVRVSTASGDISITL